MQVAGSGIEVSVGKVENVSQDILRRRGLVIPAETTPLDETKSWDAGDSTLRSDDGIICSGEWMYWLQSCYVRKT